MVRPIKIKDPGKNIDQRRSDLSGQRIDFVCCPLCLYQSVLNKSDGTRKDFDSFDLKDDFFIVRRVVGKGRGTGFFALDSESLSLSEAKKNPKYKEIIEEIKEKCKEILKDLK